MLATWGVIGLAVGAAALLASTFAVIRAYAGTRVPFWGRPSREPWWGALLRGLGAGLVTFGAIALASVIGPWSLVILLVTMAAFVAAIPLHNRRVRVRATL